MDSRCAGVKGTALFISTSSCSIEIKQRQRKQNVGFINEKSATRAAIRFTTFYSLSLISTFEVRQHEHTKRQLSFNSVPTDQHSKTQTGWNKGKIVMT